MEFVSGVDLSAWIPRRGVKPIELLAIPVQLARAPEVAHAPGIVHRHLKPAIVRVRGSCAQRPRPRTKRTRSGAK